MVVLVPVADHTSNGLGICITSQEGQIIRHLVPERAQAIRQTSKGGDLSDESCQ